MRTMHGGKIVVVYSKFMPEAVDIVNGVINCNTNANCRDCNSHHIQWNSNPAHESQHHSNLKHIWENRYQSNCK